MYSVFLHIHSIFRWLVLITLVVAVIFGFTGWLGKKRWSKKDNLAGLLLTIFIDVQFLIGIILYIFLSPITKAAFNDFGAAMKDDNLRFYAVEHVLMMILAIIIVHVGRSKSKKTFVDIKKHRNAAIFFTIALVLIIYAIPWNRALI